MPRKKFTMAPDAAARTIDCVNYDFNAGAPSCRVLNHPWCLAPGEAAAACKFRAPKKQEAKRRGKKA